MILVDCEQHSAEWWAARRGVPTASNFDKIITPVKGVLSASHVGYVDELIAQRFGALWPPSDGELFRTSAMDRGVANEPAARECYGFRNDIEPQLVGFCLSDCRRYGASPDSLVGDDGALELKCPNPNTQVRYLRENVLPIEYKCQVHGELLVTGRKWIDFFSWCEGLPPFQIRIVPDDFTEKLRVAVEEFCEILAREVAKIESMM